MIGLVVALPCNCFNIIFYSYIILNLTYIYIYLVLAIYFTSCEFINKCPNNSMCIQYHFPLIGHDCKCKDGFNGTYCELCMYLNSYIST